MLLSFAFYSRDDIGKYRAKMPCGRLLIDSGAYTAASVGKTISREEYGEFLETWKGSIDHAVTLDVIGDPKATAANTRWLHNRGHKVLPVFTRGGSPAEFDAMVRDCGYVCVGGGVGMPPAVVIRRLSALQRRAEELGGGIHALGVGNMNGLRKIRPYSADASNVSATFIYGSLSCYDGRNLRTIAHTDRARVKAHLPHFKAAGIAASVTEVIRTGKMPRGEGRRVLMRGMVVGGAAADEDATRFNVPVPHGVNDTPGTHMYMAVTGGFLAPVTAGVDTLIHDPEWSVPLWDRYRQRHQGQCRVKVPA